MSGRPGRSRRARNAGGDREDRVEEGEEDDDYEDIDNPTDQGSQEATGGQVVQRAIIIERSIFIAAAVCLTALCVLVALRTTDRVINYHSAIKELQTINTLTLERDQWKTKYDILSEKAAKLCPSGWMVFGCSCYYRSTELKSWEEHRALCLKTGADLVIIESEEEQGFIRGLITGDQYVSWIGLKRTAGNWTWINGTPLTTSQYWARGAPGNHGDRNCAAYSYSIGGWGNGGCSSGYAGYGICEK